MIETLHSEQLTNPDFQLWEREAQVNLGKLTLSAVNIEYGGGGGGSGGNSAEAFDIEYGGGGNTGNAKPRYQIFNTN